VKKILLFFQDGGSDEENANREQQGWKKTERAEKNPVRLFTENQTYILTSFTHAKKQLKKRKERAREWQADKKEKPNQTQAKISQVQCRSSPPPNQSSAPQFPQAPIAADLFFSRRRLWCVTREREKESNQCACAPEWASERERVRESVMNLCLVFSVISSENTCSISMAAAAADIICEGGKPDKEILFVLSTQVTQVKRKKSNWWSTKNYLVRCKQKLCILHS
jgi:hypothetical protein